MAITEHPDSRFDSENLSEIDTSTLCSLNEQAERMAFWPTVTPGLNDEWKAAYDRTQTELLARVARRER